MLLKELHCIASPAGRTPSVELKSDIWCSGSCLWSFSWDLKSFQYYFVFLQHNNQSRATPAHTAHQRVRVTLDGGKHKQSRHNNLCVTTNPIRTPDAMCSCSSVGALARGNWREGWECDVAINTVGGGNGWTYLSAARPTQLQSWALEPGHVLDAVVVRLIDSQDCRALQFWDE